MDNCIFCKIVKGEIPSYKVWEDENFLAFLTINPHTSGHTLVIPKEHTEYLYDMSDEKLSELFKATKPLAQKLQQVFQPQSGKIGVIVAGLEVPHVHVHLIPMNTEKDLEFSSATSASPEDLNEVQRKIQET